MIEIHSHILYGIDDGADTLEHAALLIDDYVSQGVTDVICTPHFEQVHYQSVETLNHYFLKRQQAFETLQKHVLDQNLSITLHLGAEIMLSADIIHILSEPSYRDQLRLAGSDYILVELPRTLNGGYQLLDQLLFRIQVAGLIPILAHPERSMNNPDFVQALDNWLNDERLLVQVNASSFVLDERLPLEKQMHYRRRAHHIQDLVQRHMVHFVASDAHHITARPVQNRLAKHTLISLCGYDLAVQYTSINPEKIISHGIVCTKY